MRRRDFIVSLGAAAWPLAVRAQQTRTPVLGILSAATSEQMSANVTAFSRGLADEGYVENLNFRAEYRWAEGDNARLPALATDLARFGVDAIAVLGSTPGALATKAATNTIPIAFVVGTDPVQSGLVSSLARPGGNLTGVTILTVELMAKRLSFMHELVPSAEPIAVLFNPANATQTEAELQSAQTAAKALRLRTLVLNASSPDQIDTAFFKAAEGGAGALVVAGENFFYTQRDRLVSLAAARALPAIYFSREFVQAGGLASYGASYADAFRRVGVYAGRILRGERPADLPVQQSTKVELIINTTTAKALGLTIPEALFGAANEVIE